MTRLTLVLRSLQFYRRTHLGVAAGGAVAAAVLVGALFVGDSVRGTLERIALARLGRIHSALDAGDRAFLDDLPDRLGGGAAPALRARGMAIREDPAAPRQVNRVDVLGIDRRFFALAPSPAGIDLAAGEAAVNEKLASALGVKAGDEISLRVFKPGLLPLDAPLSSRKDRDTRRGRFTVKAVLSDAQLGRFSLKSDQAAPHNAFVNLGWLQETLGLGRRANLIVTGAEAGVLSPAWKIGDAGLSVRALESRGLLQVESPRIYLDPAAARAALDLRPGAVGVLAYLVNGLSSGNGRSTPYSFMAALSPGADRRLGPVPPDMKDDEILVNRWLADRLAVRERDPVTVAYYELTPAGRFVERRRSFRVRGLLEMDALAGEKEAMPDFPGLVDVDSCKDWDIGMPLEDEKLEDAPNEEYWKKYRQTPKAFVTLAAGRAMWANRFGSLMAVRYPAEGNDSVKLADDLLRRMDPSEAGLAFRPVRAQALEAAAGSMDLGPLFLGMSSFLAASALALAALLFAFTAEQRARETGLLLAVGLAPAQARRLLLVEGALLAALGSLAGIPLGAAFTRLLLEGLATGWGGAVAHTPIGFHAKAGSAAAGALAAWLISVLAMAFVLRRQAKRPVRELLSDDPSAPASPGGRPWPWRLAFSLSAAGAAVIAVGTATSGASHPAMNFFIAGALMLASGIALLRITLARIATAPAAKRSVGSLGARNAARRPGRSLAAAGAIACGCFIVFSVSAMKEDLASGAGDRRSGTGGFELYGESSVPLHRDLNDPKGRAALRLDEGIMAGVSILPLKVRDGDDASCLNLNASPAPPLVGVDPATLAALRAFDGPWGLLEANLPDGAVPALVGDADTATWKIRKRAGETLDYRDELGRPFKVRIAGTIPMRLSLFQGRILISRRDFTRLYPSEGGFRAFLADVPRGKEEQVARHLTAKLEAAGVDVVSSVERLKEFYAVEAAYLAMFLVLGGLGLLLGSAGMGVLVLRHVLERRGELALLRAVGFTKGAIGRLVMAEHLFLASAGLAVGATSAAVAIVPSAARPGVQVPFVLLAAFLGGMAALSAGWIWIAAKGALRGPILGALRDEG
jgi:ABC-type lipoprotein release transport system permease subunit